MAEIVLRVRLISGDQLDVRYDRETVVKLALHAVGEATSVVLWQGDFATEARLALHRSGWTDSFEKLRELIKSTA